MLKKLLVGFSTETNKYFVRAHYTNIVSNKKAYPIQPTDKENCIKEIRKLITKYPQIPILHDGLCGTTESHQECIKVIIEAVDPNENTSLYNDEILEFYNDEIQFVVGRHDLSKSMIANEDERTVDALIDDYYKGFEDVYYILNILPDSSLCMKRNLMEVE